jgi:hypothetical protein
MMAGKAYRFQIRTGPIDISSSVDTALKARLTTTALARAPSLTPLPAQPGALSLPHLTLIEREV